MDRFLCMAVVLALIGVVGAVANGLVITVIVRNRKLWSQQNLLILTLAVSDFLMAIVGIPLPMMAALKRQVVDDDWLCQSEAFSHAFVGIGTIGTLAHLATSRMLIVRGHHSALKTSTWRHGVVHLAPAWCLSLLVTTPPLLGWGRYAPEGSDAISCSVDWLMTTPNALSYMVFLFLVGFFVPLLVIIGSFASIAQMIYKMSQIRSRMHSGPVAVPQLREPELRVTLLIAAMAAAFVASWGPYAALALHKIVGALEGAPPAPHGHWAATTVPVLMAKSSIVYNPIIYAVFNSQFRESWRSLFGIRETTRTRISNSEMIDV